MAIPKEFLGAIVLEVDGQEVEIISVNSTSRTGRKPVKTMNRTGKTAGFTQGVGEIELKVTAPIPVDGSDELDWDAVTTSKITIYPSTTTGKRISYLGCFTTEVGEQYSVDNEARRDISMGAIKKVIE